MSNEFTSEIIKTNRNTYGQRIDDGGGLVVRHLQHGTPMRFVFFWHTRCLCDSFVSNKIVSATLALCVCASIQFALSLAAARCAPLCHVELTAERAVRMLKKRRTTRRDVDNVQFDGRCRQLETAASVGWQRVAVRIGHWRACRTAAFKCRNRNRNRVVPSFVRVELDVDGAYRSLNLSIVSYRSCCRCCLLACCCCRVSVCCWYCRHLRTPHRLSKKQSTKSSQGVSCILSLNQNSVSRSIS
jgi:hypothetical protein